MVKLLTEDVMELYHRYNNEKAFNQKCILKELLAISLENNNSLPERFDISVRFTDANSVLQVLKDLGYENADIFLGEKSVFVQLSQE